ncbi:RodZ domain-containing protein [Azomonas macrocytogenes]|uniref:Cytoskeleton protein RodZ n=1 Tax=Azomonas macrocytogenes TaxID=69962 RepID=A0A839T1S2_AZOMA|nr:RodZ family helix-turn-helix domain-containing protein [Azomonas macrocytogenes]MBB3101895.1 cytoskeleton protein RodZ [Azomonas macrocytogenes]
MNAPQSEASAPAGPVNPGEILRSARESHGVALSVVSLQLNISERFLRQIEAGDFSQLPGHTFARGYIRAYAKLMQLDQARLVQEFDRYTGTDAKGSQVHSLGNIEEPARLSSIGLRLLTFVLLVVLGGSAFFLWQEGKLTGQGSQTSTSLGHIEVEGADGTTQIHSLDEPEDQAVAENQQTPLPLNAPPDIPGQANDSNVATQQLPSRPVLPAPISPTVSSAPAGSPPSVSVLANPTATPVLGQHVPPAQADGATVGQTAAETSGEALLELVYTADCWTRVTDADGRVLLNALVRAGASRSLQGKPPLSLRIGFARGLQLTYNGNPVDLTPYIRGETASLKLGE